MKKIIEVFNTYGKFSGEEHIATIDLNDSRWEGVSAEDLAKYHFGCANEIELEDVQDLLDGKTDEIRWTHYGNWDCPTGGFAQARIKKENGILEQMNAIESLQSTILQKVDKLNDYILKENIRFTHFYLAEIEEHLMLSNDYLEESRAIHEMKSSKEILNYLKSIQNEYNKKQ